MSASWEVFSVADARADQLFATGCWLHCFGCFVRLLEKKMYIHAYAFSTLRVIPHARSKAQVAWRQHNAEKMESRKRAGACFTLMTGYLVVSCAAAPLRQHNYVVGFERDGRLLRQIASEDVGGDVMS